MSSPACPQEGPWWRAVSGRGEPLRISDGRPLWAGPASSDNLQVRRSPSGAFSRRISIPMSSGRPSDSHRPRTRTGSRNGRGPSSIAGIASCHDDRAMPGWPGARGRGAAPAIRRTPFGARSDRCPCSPPPHSAGRGCAWPRRGDPGPGGSASGSHPPRSVPAYLFPIALAWIAPSFRCAQRFDDPRHDSASFFRLWVQQMKSTMLLLRRMRRDRDVPILPHAVLVVIPLEVITIGMIVREHGRGIFEGHPVLSLVGFGLLVVPLEELVVSHRLPRPGRPTR